MPHQSAVTVLATVLPARVDDVREVLDEANRKGAGEVFPFAEVKGAHLAGLVRSTTISTVNVALTLLARRRNCCRPATR
ncbi:hypothetical protein ACFTZK_01085 [Streptomyces decoyicus]|uniref:hypothetical protein n=1 Tax=Streptomyces decoyicus TaxID=249567 RepID=UPI0036416E1A